jgi:hypothetical protein
MKSYKSVEDMLRGEAKGFVDRAQAYLTKGELDKAIGCLNKAMVKIKRADVLKMSPLEEAIFGPLMVQLHDRIAKQIMDGK